MASDKHFWTQIFYGSISRSDESEDKMDCFYLLTNARYFSWFIELNRRISLAIRVSTLYFNAMNSDAGFYFVQSRVNVWLLYNFT